MGRNGNSKTTEQFISKSNQIHNNKFDYSLSVYKHSKIKVKIICPIHGVFEQKPNDHLVCGCKQCGYVKNAIHQKTSLKTFIENANIIHDFKYDYSKVAYINTHTKIEIICPIHNSFYQEPNSHLHTKGCPKCKTSKGEFKILKWLKTNTIHFEYQKIFNKCINPISLRKLPFDFYIPLYNIIIEFDGKQHFEPFSFDTNKTKQYMIDNLKLVQIKDGIKNIFCKNNNITIIRIPYYKYQDINNILSSLFKIR